MSTSSGAALGLLGPRVLPRARGGPRLTRAAASPSGRPAGWWWSCSRCLWKGAGSLSAAGLTAMLKPTAPERRTLLGGESTSHQGRVTVFEVGRRPRFGSPWVRAGPAHQPHCSLCGASDLPLLTRHQLPRPPGRPKAWASPATACHPRGGQRQPADTDLDFGP